MKVKELEQKINEANKAYRQGEEIITDVQYDSLLEELEALDPENKLLNKIGLEVSDESRKSKLPIPMFSMDKVKTVDEIKKWLISKNIPLSTELVLTPKYDGASLCISEITKEAWTRGNGIEGQKSDEHLKSINTNNINEDVITFGEAIMKRDVFLEKYSNEWSNPRNLVSGKLNDKKPSDILNDVDYIRYGMVGKEFNKKSDLLDFLNEKQKHKVEYKLTSFVDLTEENLKYIFSKWSKVYEIDGIIIEINDQSTRDDLGRETNNNPSYARAFKSPSFSEYKETIIESIEWEISKQGLVKPVMVVKPIEIEGVTITRCTGNNAKFMKVNEIGVGSKVKILRSGGVIPKLVEVIESTGFELPIIDGVEIGWNENEVELITLEETDEQKLKQLISFFEIMEVDNLGEGVVKQFYEAGFDTVEKILKMTKEDMMKLDKFGVRKAQKIVDSINEKRTMTISKLQHASNLFKGLGSKKLILLEHLYDLNNVSVDKITSIEGFSDISAKSYLDSIERFKSFVNGLDGLIKMVPSKQESSSNRLENFNVVFTGVRRKDLNEIIESNGGKIGSSVSKNTTHLVMKQKGSGSSKEKKALSLGVTILTVEELEEFLNNL